MQVYGISTEDMDSLTFGTPRLIRHLMAPASQKLDAMEFDHAKVGAAWPVTAGCVVATVNVLGSGCDVQAVGELSTSNNDILILPAAS